MNTVEPIRDKRKIAAMKALLNDRNPKYMIMFDIGINTGLRISDILTLTVADVSGDHVNIIEKKTGKRRRFLINRKLKRDLRKYIREAGLDYNDYLIPSRNDYGSRPIGRVQAYRVLSETGRELGLESIGTHSLRKTFGYWHYQKYHDVAMLQEIFNHSTSSITLRYIGITDDMKDESMRGFYL